MFNRLISILNNHENLRKNCLNLIPSENVLSPLAKKALVSDMGHRYFFSQFFSTSSGLSYEYRGAKYIDELIHYGKEMAKDLFNASYVNFDMLSGHLCNMSLIINFLKTGDSILCTNPEFGGYPGFAKENLPSKLDIHVHYYPQETIGSDIDVESFIKTTLQANPKIVMFSSSITIFPIPLKEISEFCSENNILLVYDASQTLGLIAGGHFQKPLEEGADIILSSTHKTFPGPQGGIIIGKRVFKEFEKQFITTDNIHLHRVAALIITVFEMKEFGEAYAKQVIANAKQIAAFLEENGISVAFRDKGYTESHQIILNKPKHFQDFTKKLEVANIILDNSGRLGTSEMTRFGMKESDMKIIAEFIGRIFNNEDPEKVKPEVIEFRRQFQTVHYCYSLDD